MSDLPEPPGLPLLGHVPALVRGPAMHRVLYAWRESYGPTFRIRLGRTTAVVISSPDIIATMLRERPETFRRARAMSELIKEIGGHGLFDAEGDEWRRLRPLAIRGLKTAYLRNAFDTITRSAARLRDQWMAAATGERIPVLDDLMRYTLEVAVGLTMGHDLDAIGRRDEPGPHQQLSLVLDTLTRRMNSPLPYWRWVRLPADRRTEAAVTQLSELIKERYADAEQRVRTGKQPDNYVESLAEACLRNGDRISEQDVTGSVLNMIVAGEDTTAATAAWAMHYLATHPQVQERVRAEAAEVLGRDHYPADTTALSRLTYAEAVVNEVIRLRPASPFLMMETTTDTTVTDGRTELRIDRGTVLVPLLTYGSDSDPERFPDPGVFDPDRWLSAAARQPSHAQGFLPFGSGPRFCPGRNLALMESTLIVSMACHNFVIDPDTSAGPVGERVTFAVLPTRLGVRLSPIPAPAR
ncbi:cytochrome P450 [Streptomyces sp. LP11]|uniref:Cytochrome P450 n=1 Tax=Streptomyces pyxinicus TaxID=2970331 RepID=A0ABT2B130_9ACTN|nr:cytochrome P450 [Streptomyces sp. LP11]MCS0602101.1 cytochrome P450 [Streptomyces sp. LP11]